MDRMPGFRPRPVAVVHGGAIATLPDHLQRLAVSRPAVLIDAALRGGAIGARVQQLLPEAVLITAEAGEPTFPSTRHAADAIRDCGADGLVAVGGGSTIDTGKIARGLLAAAVTSPAEIPAELPSPPIPFVAVPTTAGTGAEMGPSAIALDPDRNDKASIRVLALAPDVAIDDGQLTAGLPPHLTAYTGCDALAQAMLAYVSATEQSISGQLALRAIDLIYHWLPRAVSNGQDTRAREQMMLGSACSAMAMFQSPMTYACEHLFAEPLGGPLRLHHGHLVAAFLPGVAEFNAPVLAEPYGQLARHLGLAGGSTPDSPASRALVEALRALVIDLGVPALKEEAGDQPLGSLADWVMAHDSFASNPAPIPRGSVESIMYGAWQGTFRAGS